MDSQSTSVPQEILSMTQNWLDNLVELQIALEDTARRFGMKFRDPEGVIMHPVIGVDGYLKKEFELRLVPMTQDEVDAEFQEEFDT
jgi:hypothetical protein